jgi:hypothetical protein
LAPFGRLPEASQETPFLSRLHLGRSAVSSPNNLGKAKFHLYTVRAAGICAGNLLRSLLQYPAGMTRKLSECLSPGIEIQVQPGGSTVGTIREVIRKISAPFHEWPEPSKEQVEIFYAIYMEPATGNAAQPFWALPARFYFVFLLGWPADPTAWINYIPFRTGEGHLAGDPAFPGLKAGNFNIVSRTGRQVIETSATGELIVAFASTVTKDEATRLLLETADYYRILDIVSVAGNTYLVSCRPFAEVEDQKIIERIKGVRFAELNPHVSLVVPGGHWQVSAII